MRKLSVAIVCGGSPEVARLAPMYHVLRGTDWAKVDWLQTGRHDAAADDMLDTFRVTPTVRLRPVGGSTPWIEADGRSQLEAMMRSRHFDLCLVQGDTESAFLGALAAFYCQIPVGHVEAGLRTHDFEQPLRGEELRQMITRLATFHFAPTKRAFNALIAEGVPAQSISLTGSTLVDAQLWAGVRFGICCDRDRQRTHILVHLVAREQPGRDVEEVFRGVAAIARERPRMPVALSVHRDPAAREAAHRIVGGLANVRFMEGPGYVEMQRALAGALVVLTDSRVLLQEAPTYETPVLVLGGTCEPAEAAATGWTSVVGSDADAIAWRVHRLLNDPTESLRVETGGQPFGDGQAARRIADALARQFRPAARRADMFVSAGTGDGTASRRTAPAQRGGCECGSQQ